MIGDISLRQLLHESGASLVVFMRTNHIKRELGLKRKAILKSTLPQKCIDKSSYRAGMENHPDCQLPKTLNITLVTPSGDLIAASYWNHMWSLLETALESDRPFQVVTYEGLQQNMTLSLQHLQEFTGWPFSHVDVSSTTSRLPGKVSSEDLATSIFNYESLENELRTRNLTCLLEMLHAKEYEISPLCNIPRKR